MARARARKLTLGGRSESEARRQRAASSEREKRMGMRVLPRRKRAEMGSRRPTPGRSWGSGR